MAETATIGGGCFWCIEALFKQLKGVTEVVSGYSGGSYENPSYDDLHNKSTGHAEVVQITFDPTVITYKDMLEIFFAVHDPTTPNRQGNDIGEQYRSIIIYQDEKQREIAENVKASYASNLWRNPIVTEIKPFEVFYSAEDDHQNYFERNPSKAYCQVIINPKLQKFRKEFAQRLKA